MTQEQFKKAIDINEKIGEFKSFKRAFNNEYIKSISINAVECRNEERCNKRMIIQTGDELHSLINDYINRRIKELEIEYDNI